MQTLLDDEVYYYQRSLGGGGKKSVALPCNHYWCFPLLDQLGSTSIKAMHNVVKMNKNMTGNNNSKLRVESHIIISDQGKQITTMT